MILSESEKNRIKGLYGIINEQYSDYEIINNSKLVKYKNPFNDLNTLREITDEDGNVIIYNRNLDEGQLFLNSKYKALRIDLLNKVKEELKKGLLNKTFKDTDGNTYMFTKNIIDNVRIVFKTKAGYPINNEYYGGTSVVLFNFGDKQNNIVFNLSNNDITTSVIELPENTKIRLKEYFEKNIKELLLLKVFPDGYFGINKIQRQETDF